MTDAQDAGIILISEGNGYWLVQGEAHFGALLSNEEEYPVPVLCVRFESLYEMTSAMPEGVTLASHWAVHPNIIKRLEQQGHILYGTL